jgi:hypothetical protein
VYDQYEHLMSARPRGARRLLHYRGEFDSLPREIRQKGPWASTAIGKMIDLKPEYRLALARDSYVLIEGKPMDFRPEN